MKPLYAGSEYYKKMLDLQERLRKSEEERLRLEERFSSLEQESRSRHETCINRLRMRYIDFLEEQQARDERNHQLLGALDRVDSSLALMSAKSDKLGALRKQYEASLLLSQDTRRANGSVTGDSGVASQNDDRFRRLRTELSRATRRNASATMDHAPMPFNSQEFGNFHSSLPGRSSSSQGSNWSGIRQESPEGNPPLSNPHGFSRSFQGAVPTRSSNRREGPMTFVDGSEYTKNTISTRISPDRAVTLPQGHKYRNSTSPSSYRYRDVDLSRYSRTAYPLLESTRSPIEEPNFQYGGSIVRNLATSGAYESAIEEPKFLGGFPVGARIPKSHDLTSGRENSFPKRSLNFGHLGNPMATGNRNLGYIESSIMAGNPSFPAAKPTVSPSSPSSSLSDILRQELDDEDEKIGSLVENQLERYISKIRSMHRDAGQPSYEENDHEQNTSGDLLNVTLSEDSSLELPAEEKPREMALRDPGRSYGEAKGPYEPSTGAIGFVDVSQGRVISTTPEFAGSDDGKFVIAAPAPKDSENERKSSRAEIGRLGASINRLHGETSAEETKNTNLHYGPPAKNEISGMLAKSRPESEGISETNRVDEIARMDENSRGKAEGIGSTKETDDKSDCQPLGKASRIMDEQSAANFSSVLERANNEALDDNLEELEPWNLNALERRVQEIILNDEAQDGFVRKGIRDNSVGDSNPQEFLEESISSVDKPEDESERQISEPKAGNETGQLDMRQKEVTSGYADNSIIESSKIPDNMKSPQQDQYEKNQTVNESMESSEQENLHKNFNPADPNAKYAEEQASKNQDQEDRVQAAGEYPGDSNLQYGFAEGQYHENPDQEYQQYGIETGARYEETPDGQYGYGDQEYANQYAEGPDQQYSPDPNQQYSTDPNQEYSTDPSQQYSTDPNQQYSPDPNQQYSPDPNQQYSTDPNQQYSTDPNQQYSADPNQEYSTDPSQQYSPDPNQQYSADPNQEYSTDPNQQYNDQEYVGDSNQQFAPDPAQAYADDAQQYNTAENQQYYQDGQYMQSEGQGYPVASTGYPYTEDQGYPDETVYPEGQAGSTVPYEAATHEGQTSTQMNADHASRELEHSTSVTDPKVPVKKETTPRKTKDVIKSILDSETESSIERNVSNNTESDFDFN